MNWIPLLASVKMVDYTVTVATGDLAFAGTFNNVYIKLVGTDGESQRTSLKGDISFSTAAAVASFTVSCPVSIGKLILIEIDKQPFFIFPEDSWFPAKVEVKSPEGDTYNFPIYHWIIDSEVHRFREATALRVFEDNHHLGRYSREQELKQRGVDYRWDVYLEGIPHCMRSEGPRDLPYEVQFSFTKMAEFRFTAAAGLVELELEKFYQSTKNWPDMDAVHRVFSSKRTKISDYVQEHWKEDAFFGYQFLNGVNPMLIQRCSVLPNNFPVSDDMVSLGGQCSLADEMEKGNIFLCDYKRLNDLKTNIINGKKQYLMAPLVLLHKTPDDQLMPIAIQPEDSRKSLHLATVYQEYNVASMQTFSTPEERRLWSTTGCTYTDGLWQACGSVQPGCTSTSDNAKFVQGVLSFYYKKDSEVQKDSELQKWILDIFEHGFLSQAGTGIPESFTTVAELVKFVTMVIFTCSGQHSAVNAGQYDYGGWMPNTPLTLQRPPPTTKGTTSVTTMMKTFPDVNTTVHGMAVVWLLGKQSTDSVFLGKYPEELFSEKMPCKLIQDFQKDLHELSEAITDRNGDLEVPYTYLDPKVVENSVAL
ncbi:polyunsaturated fatty acid lipoxygenase ALOX15B-like [Lycodopsis pacificus]